MFTVGNPGVPARGGSPRSCGLPEGNHCPTRTASWPAGTCDQTSGKQKTHLRFSPLWNSGHVSLSLPGAACCRSSKLPSNSVASNNTNYYDLEFWMYRNPCISLGYSQGAGWAPFLLEALGSIHFLFLFPFPTSRSSPNSLVHGPFHLQSQQQAGGAFLASDSPASPSMFQGPGDSTGLKRMIQENLPIRKSADWRL